MENPKYIKLVVAALVISLILNFNLLSRVGEIENQMNDLSYMQQSMTQNINGQTKQIRNVLDEFKEEQSWISRIEMNTDVETTEERGQVDLTFTWQVKELQSDSKVDFHYAYGHQSEEFITLPVEEIQQGLFQVNVPLAVEMEPQWNVSRHTVSSQGSHTTTEEAFGAENSGQPVRFFVSVTTDAMVRSGNIQTERLDHLGGRYYGDIIADILSEEERLTVNFTYHRPFPSTQKIKRVDLLTYEESALLSEQEIELDQRSAPNDPHHFFGSIQQERKDSLRHVIRVRYSDGKMFEKEI